MSMSSEGKVTAQGNDNLAIGGDVINSTIGDKIILPPKPAEARFQLRAPVGDFVGREKEIESLINALLKGNAIVSGMGGTELPSLAVHE